jgi:hypothetical protein
VRAQHGQCLAQSTPGTTKALGTASNDERGGSLYTAPVICRRTRRRATGGWKAPAASWASTQPQPCRCMRCPPAKVQALLHRTRWARIRPRVRRAAQLMSACPGSHHARHQPADSPHLAAQDAPAVVDSHRKLLQLGAVLGGVQVLQPALGSAGPPASRSAGFQLPAESRWPLLSGVPVSLCRVVSGYVARPRWCQGMWHDHGQLVSGYVARPWFS